MRHFNSYYVTRNDNIKANKSNSSIIVATVSFEEKEKKELR